MVAATVSGSVVTILVALGAAATFATFVAVIGRRRIDRTRSSWRAQDRIEGWVDDRRRWHPGAVDIVLGWEDDQGEWHPGHDVLVAEHDRRLADLERTQHGP